MKKVALLIVIVLATLAIPAQAQTAIEVEYGTTITDMLAGTQQDFVFNGVTGEVVYVEFGSSDFESELESPTIAILDPNGTELVTSDSFGTAEAFAQLPVDGAYTIRATVEVPGEFTFMLLNPEILTSGSSVSNTATSEEPVYYAVQSEQPFSLSYTKSGGDFGPEISVNVQGSFGLEAVGVMGGVAMNNGSINVDPAPDGIYILRVGTGLFDFNFQVVTAEFTIDIE